MANSKTRGNPTFAHSGLLPDHASPQQLEAVSFPQLHQKRKKARHVVEATLLIHADIQPGQSASSLTASDTCGDFPN